MESVTIVAESAQVHITWALSIIGGSIATILGASYLSPENKRVRLIYLLFLPAWALLGLSIYFGDRVFRRYIAAGFVADELRPDIVRAMGRDYEFQQWTLLAAVILFMVWLVSYLVWWIFARPPTK